MVTCCVLLQEVEVDSGGAEGLVVDAVEGVTGADEVSLALINVSVPSFTLSSQQCNDETR